MAFFTELEKNNPKIHMETQQTSNSQSDRDKEQNWTIHTSGLIILQSYANTQYGTEIKTDTRALPVGRPASTH